MESNTNPSQFTPVEQRSRPTHVSATTAQVKILEFPDKRPAIHDRNTRTNNGSSFASRPGRPSSFISGLYAWDTLRAAFSLRAPALSTPAAAAVAILKAAFLSGRDLAEAAGAIRKRPEYAHLKPCVPSNASSERMRSVLRVRSHHPHLSCVRSSVAYVQLRTFVNCLI